MSAQKKTYSDLKDFLRKNKTIPEKEFTHTSLGNVPHSYPGSYCIDDSELNLFYNLYKKHVFDENKAAHLTEKHKDCSQILIDLDLRHNYNADNKRKYNKQFLKDFVKIYVETLNSVITNIDKKYLKAYVLEKPKPRKSVQGSKNILKDGIHIMFPYIISEPKLQYLIRYKVITNEKIKELFEGIESVNSLEDIFDIAVIERNNWQMYGSCKPNNSTYKLTHIIDYNDGDVKCLVNNHSDLDLIKILSIRNIKDKYKLNVSEYMSNIEEEFESIPKNQKVKKRKKPINKKRKSPTNKNFLDNDEELQFVKDCVKILSDKRVDSYDNWIRLGWCLHNIDYRLLQTWIEKSKKSYKFVEGECENEWPIMNNEGLGQGTLYLWAKEDNLEKFKQISEQNLRKCMLDSLSLTPNDIAKVVYHLYKQEFVCSNSKKNIWYQFKDHRWNEIDDAINLRKKLSDEVVIKYEKLNTFLAKKIETTHDNAEKDVYMAKQKIILKIISSLRTTSFKKNVIHECNELFHDSKFEEKLDTNVSLLGFENGVYDLDSFVFRDGLPEDYIKFSTKINYEEYDEDEEEMVDVVTFLSQVLPKKNIREYVLKLLGSFLSGKTNSEKFHIWTGCGGNGKSKLIELFEYAFGDYCCKLPVTLLTQPRGRAEGATPALVRTKGKRFACLQEPDKHEEIQVGLMKELTGGDTIIARGLHKDPVEFKPQFKMVLTCNDLPSVSANDRGTWRRISVVDFPSKFVDEPDPDDAFEFQIDENLDEKLKIWPEAFMSLLISYYIKYRKNGIKEPEEVKKFTEEYKSESDIYMQFFNEKLVVLDDCDNEGIKLDDIYFVFQEWFKEANGQSNKCPTRKELTSNLNKRYGNKNNKKVWKGLAFKDKDDEIFMD